MNTALSFLGSTLRGVFTVGSRDKNTTIKRDEFFEACKYGNATIVESLFDKKYINRGVRFASANGHLEVVKYLVEMGANFRVEDEEPVRFASFYDHLEVVKYLVEKGADFRARGNWAILSASELGNLEIVKYLTEKGADFRAEDDYAVKMASANGHLEVVKYLVEKGADFRALDNYAVRYASFNGYFKVAKYLVEMGAPESLIGTKCREYIKKSKIRWSRINHSDFSIYTKKLFGCFFLGIQRLEETGLLPLAHQAMLEDILEGWVGEDDYVIG